jgi:hypothetical protein
MRSSIVQPKLWVLCAALGGCAAGCNPDALKPTPAPESVLAHDIEPRAASTPEDPERMPNDPLGLVYVAGQGKIYKGHVVHPSSGVFSLSFESQQYNGGSSDQVTPRCSALPAFNDIDITVGPWNSWLQSYPAFVSSTTLLKDINPPYYHQILLYHTGDHDRLVGQGTDCAILKVPSADVDTSTIAFVPGDGDKVSDAVWVVWNDGVTGNTHDWRAIVHLGPGGQFLDDTADIAQLPNPGESDVAVDWGDCTPTDSGSDIAGRVKIRASSAGAVFRSFVDISDIGATPEKAGTRRVWVERLTEPRYVRCLSTHDAALVANERNADVGDPDLAIDDATGTIAVTYSSSDGATSPHRIELAYASINDLSAWKKLRVHDPGVTGDQSQPAIAVTKFQDLANNDFDRAISGVFSVSWYEPSGDANLGALSHIVRRVAREFTINGDGFLVGTTTVPIQLSLDFTPNNDKFLPFGARGVYEYQGATHVPGGARWFAVWSDSTTTGNFFVPADSDYQLHYTMWP